MKGGVRLYIRQRYILEGRCETLHHITKHSCWGGSRSTKPSVFPCKAASASDERYLVCAAGAPALVSSANRFSLGVLHRVVAHVCVALCVS